jgi:hypothetical protein
MTPTSVNRYDVDPRIVRNGACLNYPNDSVIYYGNNAWRSRRHITDKLCNVCWLGIGQAPTFFQQPNSRTNIRCKQISNDRLHDVILA